MLLSEPGSKTPGLSYDENGGFVLRWSDDGTDLLVTSELGLDDSSAHFKFEAIPLVRKNLAENSIRCVYLRTHVEKRIGWLIPANALASRSHDFAENEHFLRYAFVAIREVLSEHYGLFASSAESLRADGVQEVSFGQLFDDNVGFLVVCLNKVDSDYHADRLTPTLVSLGYIPLAAQPPEGLSWSCQDLEFGSDKLSIRPTGVGLDRPELPAQLFVTAATSAGSLVTQFFYLYQVVEFLMEQVLFGVLPSAGQRISAAIGAGEYLQLREHLEDLNGQLSEKARLKILMNSFEGGDAFVIELAEASAEFLSAVGIDAKPGISSLYQVRNYIVHQARNMPKTAESQLTRIVVELATFLPKVLSTFKLTES